MIVNISLEPTDQLAWEYVEADYQFLIESQILGRINQAKAAIVALAVEKYLSEGISIPPTKDEIIQDAYARGWFVKAKDAEEVVA